MSIKILEINTVLQGANTSTILTKLWMEKHGDIYVTQHSPDLMAGKFSYHQSGVTHSYSDLIGKRSGEGEPPRARLRGLQGFTTIDAMGGGSYVFDQASPYRLKSNTDRRHTLCVQAPGKGWSWHAWAVERGRRDMAERIAATDPWPLVPVTAHFLADWSDPWILVTFAVWADEHPYNVVEYMPPIPGRVPFEIIPAAYEGTWLESNKTKWRPGMPFPDSWINQAEQYVARQRKLEVRRRRNRAR